MAIKTLPWETGGLVDGSAEVGTVGWPRPLPIAMDGDAARLDANASRAWGNRCEPAAWDLEAQPTQGPGHAEKPVSFQ